MKKKLVLFMCTLSVIAFAACGSTSEEMPSVEEEVSTEVVEDDSEEDEAPAKEEVEEVTDDEEVAAPAEEEEIADDASEENGDEEITLGHNDGAKYENDYFGIGCEFDSNWTLENEEQILARNQIAKSLVDEKFASAFDNAANITDMVAVHSNGMDTVNAGIEKLQGAAILIDEQQYIDITLPQLDEMFTSMGLQDINATAGEMTFAGSKHKCIEVTASFNGVAVYETLVVVKKKNYMLCVTACTWQANGVNDLLANFYNY